ncbi:MAG TPA: AAA family ATPase, partial [Thermoanaerobaculia bacterium]
MTRWEEAARAVQEELRRRIVGMDDVIEKMLLCILTRNHALLVGVPGLAKTLLVSSLAEALDLSFARIQFTPDLMPSDITGTEVLAEEKEQGTRTFRFLPGPVFANIILADEINRTPPKTQAALMEAMEERQVTSVGKRYPLPDPFFVLATQNPIEQEGTYPLPAAQLDRFMFRIRIEYPDAAAEKRIARRTTGAAPPRIAPVLSRRDIEEFGREVVGVELPAALEEQIVEATRSWDDELQSVLMEEGGEETGVTLHRRYASAFPAAYRDDLHPRLALADIRRMEGMQTEEALDLSLYRPL